MENKETINEITNEELRRQIKGNLMIAADSWPIHQLRTLEVNANRLAMAGLFSEGLLYSGIMEISDLLFDKAGKIKLTSNPDDADNIFRVLANQIAKNDAREAARKAETSAETSEAKPGDSDYSKFF